MCSVADPGSGAFLPPGSVISFFRFPDLGSPTHISESLVTNIWVKSTILVFFAIWLKYFCVTI
jgi:hypothetical protein